MPVDRKSTKRKTKTLADKKQVAPEKLERTPQKLEQVLVERLIEEAGNLPAIMTALLRTKGYEKMVALHKPITWSLVVRASAKRGNAYLEVGTDLITERP
jgi:hypothetical protein